MSVEMKGYRVVEAFEPSRLATLVTELLKEGWELHGQFHVDTLRDVDGAVAGTRYLQAMVHRDPERPRLRRKVKLAHEP